MMSAEITGLIPGHTYRSRIQGENDLGVCEWSEASISQGTLAGLPYDPERPKLVDRTLTSITFSWIPPNDGGTAITGYRYTIYLSELSV